MLLPYFFSKAIGGLSVSDESVVVASMVAAGAVGLLGVVMNLVGFQSLVRHEAAVRYDLSNETFAHIIRKDMRFFVNTKVGALTSKYIDFIRAEVVLQDLLIIRTLGFVLSMSIGLVLVALQAPALAGLVGVLIGALLVQVRWSMRKRVPWRTTKQQIRADLFGAVADAITNNLVVKTFAGENHEIKTVARHGQRYAEVYKKDIGFISYEGSARNFVMVGAQVLVISICAMMALDGRMDVATVVFVLAFLQRLASQLFSLGELLNGYDQALLEAAPMSEMLATPTIVNDKPRAKTLVIAEPTIRFENVSYRYKASADDILHNIDLTIQAGEKVGLVGHSGAGKTTLGHLLLRFGDVTTGRILIDNKNIQDVTQESLRKNIAFVPQEPMLFHRSLRENIAYGKLGASDEELLLAARHANATEFIQALPNGLDTLVGERGIKLSGGQRQRIAVARALLKDAPILLLDEATSALDSESEVLIQKALWKLMEGRTAVVVAHRLSTIQKMDRIVVLDHGHIAEQGTHKELLAQNGQYAKLWAHQSGGFIEE